MVQGNDIGTTSGTERRAGQFRGRGRRLRGGWQRTTSGASLIGNVISGNTGGPGVQLDNGTQFATLESKTIGTDSQR